MNCPFCAESIQDAAVLCRFCGATLSPTGEWHPPARAVASPARRPGQFTIQSAGVLFLLSGILSFSGISADAALLGALHNGAVAVGYNLLFTILYFAMGAGLFSAQPWGYMVIMGGTAFYSLDRLLFMLSKPTRDAYLEASGMVEQVQSLIDMDQVDELLILSSIVTLLCWWGFALYIYLRRAYFDVRSDVQKPQT